MINSDIIAAKAVYARTQHPISIHHSAQDISQTPLMSVFNAVDLPARELLLSEYSITIYTCGWRDLVGIKIINKDGKPTFALYGHIASTDTDMQLLLLTQTGELMAIDNKLEERALMRILDLAGYGKRES